MIGDYSIMEWVTLGGILTTICTIIGIFVTAHRDTNVLTEKQNNLSEGIGGLSGKISSERQIVTKENEAIKSDTKYIYDQMLAEKMARKNLYENTSRAKEILETIDVMKEVVNQNTQLNAEVSALKFENHKLSTVENDDKFKYLSSEIRNFQNQLSEFESFNETEEINRVLKNILNRLSEYDD